MSESKKGEDEANDADKSSEKSAPAKKEAAPPKKSGPIKRFFKGLGIVVLVLLVILVAKALTNGSKQSAATPSDAPKIDDDKAAQHLARALTFQTVSHQDAAQDDPAAFEGLHAALAEMFPKAHATLTREVVGKSSLLYTWKGKDPSKAPIVLLGHQDVVPVEPGTEGDWTKPPFGGVIDGGFVWGRGALDFKMAVVGLLEAAEALINEGYQPSRTIYFAFGHDEEVSGYKGAVAIAELLKSRGVHAAFVLDEGMVITEGILKGIDRPVALIGVAEKGYLTLEVSVEGQGGHSSMPAKPTTVGVLASAIQKLEAHPMPAHIDGPARALFDTLAPEMPFGNKLILSNLWLLTPVAKMALSKSPATDAILRTTTAPTMLDASVKENVLPKRARALVNFRILPGDTRESVTEHAKAVIDDPRVTVKPVEGSMSQDPSSVSDPNSASFKLIERSIRQIFPDAIVAPSLVLGATDSRHYQAIADGVYRFAPQRTHDEDRARLHGTNERISVKNFGEAVRFYAQLVKNGDSL
ncbi:MAG: M20 family peptidase [Polyangiaceae bacterium]